MKSLIVASFFALFSLCSPAFAQEEPMGVAAVVNEEMISTYDVENRLHFLLASSGQPDDPALRGRRVQQVLESLVTERLQLQEAKRQGIKISDDEIKGAFAQINQQRGMPPGALEKFLAENHLDDSTVKDQVRAQLAWAKTVSKVAKANVRISDADVERERTRLAAGENVTEYNISSILLPVCTIAREAAVNKQAEELVEGLHKGENFEMLARQYSAGSEATVKDHQAIWVQLHQLDPKLAAALQTMEKGQVSDPVRTQGGYQIIKLNDQRTTNTAKIRDSEVLLKEITMKLKPTAQTQEANVLLDIAREVAKHPGTCQQKEVAGMDDLADLQFNVEMQRANFSKIKPEMQQILTHLRVGDVSEPFATPEGIHLIMLCERVDKPVQLPSADSVRDALFRDRLSGEAEKLMRNLRREAFIESRI